MNPSAFRNRNVSELRFEREPVNERLYHSFEAIQQERQHERETSLALRRQLELQECTFQPHSKGNNSSLTGSRFDDVQPKFHIEVERPDYEELKVKFETRGCTFKPNVRRTFLSIDQHLISNLLCLILPFMNSSPYFQKDFIHPFTYTFYILFTVRTHVFYFSHFPHFSFMYESEVLSFRIVTRFLE